MKIKILIFLLITLSASRCKKDESIPDPEKRILGKWTLSGQGNGNNIVHYSKTCYIYEFEKDSVFKSYACSDVPYIGKYWMDSLLHIGFPESDTNFYFITNYYYSFKGNELTLTYKYVDALITTFIYTKK